MTRHMGQANGGMFPKLPRLESRALKYGYSNARVKAMKGLLLNSSFLNEMIRVGTVEGMVELLQKTGYKNDFAPVAAVNYSGSQLIEFAASRNFARTVQKVLTFTPKEDRPLVRALLVKWDLTNLKTLMHAKRLKRSYEEVKPYLFPVGGLTEDDFVRIMKADGNDVYREIRRTKLGAQMLSTSTASFSRQMWDAFSSALRSLNTFLQMETIIDAYMYLFMDKALSEMGDKELSRIRAILKKEIDAKNILIIERLKRYGTDRNKIKGSLIRGGTLGDVLIDKLIDAKDIPAVVTLVRPKFSKLSPKDNLQLASLEIALEKSLAAQKTLAFHQAVLSIGVIVGFLLLKEEEINNLRKIAKAKEFGIAESEVREMLVVV